MSTSFYPGSLWRDFNACHALPFWWLCFECPLDLGQALMSQSCLWSLVTASSVTDIITRKILEAKVQTGVRTRSHTYASTRVGFCEFTYEQAQYIWWMSGQEQANLAVWNKTTKKILIRGTHSCAFPILSPYLFLSHIFFLFQTVYFLSLCF